MASLPFDFDPENLEIDNRWQPHFDSLRIPVDNQKTSGTFVTEKESWDAFDAIMDLCQCVQVYKEVPGEFINPRAGTGAGKVRIDRIILPLQSAIDSGWTFGCVGVEGKKSETKSGKLISQSLDYSRCVFPIKEIGNVYIMPTWIFIFPFLNPFCDLESIMLNNRIGCACITRENGLSFAAGSQGMIDIDRSGRMVRCIDRNIGNRRGSR